jgi:hypothetical protein
MRRQAYVEDVMADLARPIEQADRKESWRNLARSLELLDLLSAG